jgi:hypothetical protein
LMPFRTNIRVRVRVRVRVFGLAYKILI